MSLHRRVESFSKQLYAYKTETINTDEVERELWSLFIFCKYIKTCKYVCVLYSMYRIVIPFRLSDCICFQGSAYNI